MFVIQMYRPSERGVKNEPVVHWVLAGLTLAAPISRSPVGALVVTVHCVDSIWMFKQEVWCVCVDLT